MRLFRFISLTIWGLTWLVVIIAAMIGHPSGWDLTCAATMPCPLVILHGTVWCMNLCKFCGRQKVTNGVQIFEANRWALRYLLKVPRQPHKLFIHLHMHYKSFWIWRPLAEFHYKEPLGFGFLAFTLHFLSPGQEIIWWSLQLKRCMNSSMNDPPDQRNA